MRFYQRQHSQQIETISSKTCYPDKVMTHTTRSRNQYRTNTVIANSYLMKIIQEGKKPNIVYLKKQSKQP